MPRWPAGHRSRRREEYSPVSVDGEEESPITPSKCRKEDKVFKPVALDVHEDYWASFLVSDATIYKADGKTIGNLLTAESEGPYIIRGSLLISSDDDDIRHLKNPGYSGQRIEIRTDAFSIGCDPITLWARGEQRWFEIRPSEQYAAMYTHMSEGIVIYFAMTDIYEEYRESKKGTNKTLKINEVLEKYALIEGSGLDHKETAERIKSHAGFLLSQMSKGGNWSSTLFYRWLACECIDVHTALRARKGQGPEKREAVIISKPAVPLLLRSPSPEPIANLLDLRSPSPSPAPSESTDQDFITSRPDVSFTDGPSTGSSLPADTPAGLLLGLIHGCILDPHNTHKKSNFTLSKVATILNYNYSIRSKYHPVVTDHNLCKYIVHYWAKPLLAAISSDPGFRDSPLLRDLRTALVKAPEYNQKIADEIRDMKFVRRKSNGKRSETSTAFSLARETVYPPTKPSNKPGITNRHENTPTHASKSILPPNSHRKPGKQSSLRPAPTPLKRDSSVLLEDADTATDEAPEYLHENPRRRKRRRESPVLIEMGESSPTPAPASPSSDRSSSSASASLVNATSTLSLQFKATSIPSMTSTGPNGTWVCPYSTSTSIINPAPYPSTSTSKFSKPTPTPCTFTHASPLTPSGQSEINAHLLAHADGLVKEKLVEQEAVLAGGRKELSHLLEFLKRTGESSRPVLGGMGGGREGGVGGHGTGVGGVKRALAA